ncbi:MAG: hypothetical protein ABIF85_04030 [Nanoarchaeota archaeon]
MKKNKFRKGFIYTLYTILFLSALMLFLSMQKSENSGSELAEKIRADKILSFEKAISNDINRGVYISGKRALLSLDNILINGNGTFSSQANASIGELIRNGSLEGAPAEIMENSTIINWTQSISTISSRQKIDALFDVENILINSASAFEISAKINISIYLYDPFTKIEYNRTIEAVQNIPIYQLEDPYIAIKSFGTISNTFSKCSSIKGLAYEGIWTYGKIYSSNESSFPADPVWRNERILVTNGTEGKDYSSFRGVVVENATDAVSGVPYIKGIANAVALSKTDTYAALSNNTLWLANGTSCYFESPLGPSFFDRFEGRDELSAKYALPDAMAGLGAFILTFDKGWCLDYKYYYSGNCF